MAQTVDYSLGATHTVTITNNAKQIEATDAGSAQHGKTYLDTDRWVNLYRVNLQVGIPMGDSLKLAVETSEEVAYYMALNGVNDLAVVKA